ncbi:MAG: FecR domain-containing protein [Lachnospiraceae bacterium]|nr:FecR domain-containing protein [Lachnospiraceae bacterium]
MNKKALIFGGGALALVAIIVACIFIFMGGEDAYRSIKVFEIDGSCKVERDGDTLDAFKNMALSSGDTLTVGDGSFTRLKLDDDKYVYLEANTKIKLTATGTANDSKTAVFIERGSMLTEVKKKLSATSSYDIVTPNTTMSIRGTKTLTEVVEDVVTGHVQTSNAVLEGQVKIKAVKVKADGTVVSVERDLGAGEGNAFKSSKEELVSQEEMQVIAETGASVSGIKVEIVSEEEAGVVFDVATFDATFLESVKSLLIADAEAAAGEDGLSQEEIDAINAQVNEAVKSLEVISEESQNAINAAEEPDNPEPEPEVTPQTSDDPIASSDSDIRYVAEDDTQDEGTTLVEGDTNLIDIADDADDDAGDNAGTVVNNDDNDDESGTDDNNGDDTADEEDADNADADEDDNAGEDEEDNADDESDEEDADKEDGEEDEDIEDSEEEDADKEDDGEEEKSEDSTDESAVEADSNESDSKTGSDQSSSQTLEPAVSSKPVTYSYSRSFSTSSQGSVSEQDTVSLVFKQGSEVISADMLPSSYAVNSPLPGSNGSNYSVSVDSAHAAEYQFTGWYVTEQLAQEADPAKSVANMPSSSSSNVPLYAGIRKIPVKITITNMYPHAGRFYAPERDSAGHEYALTGESEQYPNILTISGYEYGDEFALPEEGYNALSYYNADLSETPYVGGFTESHIYDYDKTRDEPYYPLHIIGQEEREVLFVGYSTVSNVDLMETGGFTNIENEYTNLQQYHPIENGVEGQMFYNYNMVDYPKAFGEEGAGINQKISLTTAALSYNDHDNIYELKLYAYFGTFVEINFDSYYADKMLIKTSDGDKKLSELPTSQDINVIEKSGSGERTRIWRIENYTLTTLRQGSSSVVIPEIKIDTSTLNPDKYTIRLSDYSDYGTQKKISYINNGTLEINESFYGNGQETFALFDTELTKYVVLDLDIDLTVNHLGDMNRYYIKEAGDSISKKYKMAVVEYEWYTGHVDPCAQEVGAYGGHTIADDYTLVGAPESIDAFTSGQSSGNTKIRNYVMVPDDAYYPWGMKGEAKFSDNVIDDVDQENYEDYVGTELYSKLSYVGDPFGKLYGYSVSYGYGDNRKTVNALYSERNRGVPNDYSMIVKTNDTQSKSVGVLLSIGLDGELFDDSTQGQVVLKPLMGPHKQPFWFSLIYDYAGYEDGTYSYTYPNNVADGYMLRITLPSPGNLGVLGVRDNRLRCEYITDIAQNYGPGVIDLTKISWGWREDNNTSPANYIASYIDTVSQQLCEVTPTVDNKGFYYYDIPLMHLIDGWNSAGFNFVRGLISGSVDYTNVYMQQNLSATDTPYAADSFSLLPDVGNYIPCAFDVRVNESDICKFTGFASVYAEGGWSLRRVVQESDHVNCQFKKWTVVEDLQFMTGTRLEGPFWGAYVYGKYASSGTYPELYGYYTGNNIVPCEGGYSKLLTYNSTGYIDTVLHGTTDTNRYGGLLICWGGTGYVKFANSNLSSITKYSDSNGSIEVATGDEATVVLSAERNEIGSIDASHDIGQIIKLNGKVYMRICHTTLAGVTCLVEITEDGANGSAIIDSLMPPEQ